MTWTAALAFRTACISGGLEAAFTDGWFVIYEGATKIVECPAFSVPTTASTIAPIYSTGTAVAAATAPDLVQLQKSDGTVLMSTTDVGVGATDVPLTSNTISIGFSIVPGDVGIPITGVTFA